MAGPLSKSSKTALRASGATKTSTKAVSMPDPIEGKGGSNCQGASAAGKTQERLDSLQRTPAPNCCAWYAPSPAAARTPRWPGIARPLQVSRPIEKRGAYRRGLSRKTLRDPPELDEQLE